MTSNISITGVDFVSVPTQDLQRASDFYADVLGLERGPIWGRGGMEDAMGVEFETGTVTIALMANDKLGIPFSPTSVPIALHVEDVAAARTELESRGVTFEMDTIDSGVCHQAIFKDSEGNVLDLHHRYAPKG